MLIGCGDDSSHAGPPDGGSDATGDVHQVGCIADFPCSEPWSCGDSTHWVAMETLSCDHICSKPCSGLTCGESDAGWQSCPAGLECIDPYTIQIADYAGPFCAFGGVAGCTPVDESGFTPQPMTAAPPKLPACTDVGVEQFWSRCFDPATQSEASCAYWRAQFKSCGDCLAPVLSPYEEQSSQTLTLFPNVSGCYAVLDGATSKGSCADLASSSMQCAIAACSMGCDMNPDAFVACAANARTSRCGTFPTCSADAGSSYAICEAPKLGDFYVGFGKALCVGP